MGYAGLGVYIGYGYRRSWTQAFYTFLSSEKCLSILNCKETTYQVFAQCTCHTWLLLIRRKVRPTSFAHIVHKDSMQIMHNFATLPVPWYMQLHAVIPALHPILRSFAEGAHMSCGILLLLLLYNTSLYCSHDQILLSHLA
jgi:hypothetical protein